MKLFANGVLLALIILVWNVEDPKRPVSKTDSSPWELALQSDWYSRGLGGYPKDAISARQYAVAASVAEQREFEQCRRAVVTDPAQRLRLGGMYVSGRGTPQDLHRALEQYELYAAAIPEDAASAYYCIAQVLEALGDDTYFTYLERAAELKDGPSCLRLARIYLTGTERVAKDAEKGVHYLESAVAYGFDSVDRGLWSEEIPLSMEIAQYYEEGTIVNRDYDKAVAYYQHALNIADRFRRPPVARALARLYLSGHGCTSRLVGFWQACRMCTYILHDYGSSLTRMLRLLPVILKIICWLVIVILILNIGSLLGIGRFLRPEVRTAPRRFVDWIKRLFCRGE